MTLFGWDASNFDHSRGRMDMAAAARDGISFYTHKATEGTSTLHHPGASLAAARDAGIPFLGCYMVPRTPGPSVAAQVSYFLQWVDKQAPWWRTFPGWFWQMDTEHWTYDAVRPGVGHEAAQLLAARTGRRVLHYAPEWAYGGTVPAGEALWASSYVAGSGPYRALYPGDGSSRWHAYSGRTPAILQYSSKATIGSQPGCDANAFRGSTADFARLIGAQQGEINVMELIDRVVQESWETPPAEWGAVPAGDPIPLGSLFGGLHRRVYLAVVGLVATFKLAQSNAEKLDKLLSRPPAVLSAEDRQDIARQVVEQLGALRFTAGS